MSEVEHRRRKLREAEAELEAARKRRDLDAAAQKVMRAKAELRELEAAEGPKRRASRAASPAGASS
jgi:hypothetical protein